MISQAELILRVLFVSLSYLNFLRYGMGPFNIVLNLNLFSESCQVEVSLVKCFNPNQSISGNTDITEEIKLSNSINKKETDNYIDISDVIKLNVSPKAALR